jgi:hypothetical protein
LRPWGTPALSFSATDNTPVSWMKIKSIRKKSNRNNHLISTMPAK